MSMSAFHNSSVLTATVSAARTGMDGQCDNLAWWRGNWWRLCPPAVPFASARSRDS